MNSIILQTIAGIFVLGLFLPTQLRAQTSFNQIVFVVQAEDKKNIKSNKAAKRYNDKLKAAVKNYWYLDLEYKFMEYKDAYKFVGNNKNALVAEIETKMSTSSGPETNLNFRKGKILKLELQVRLPISPLNDADMAFAIMHTQFMYKNRGKYKKPSKELPREFGHLLKKKTLLVAESCLSRNFSKSDFEKHYPHKFKIISDEQLSQAILDKEDDLLVLYEASDSGIVSNTTYSYWSVYEPNTGVVVSRHSGTDKGLNKADIDLILKRTGK